MAKRFVDDRAREAFEKAIVAVEKESSAELVIKVRHHSGSYFHADLLAGILVMVATSAYMLFTPSHHFSTPALLIDPLLALCAAAALTTQLPMVRRWLTPAKKRRERVRQAAHAAFFRRGVRLTQNRIGVLVYVSLLEQDVALICDQGVIDACADGELEKEEQRLRETLHTSFDGASLAAGIETLGELFATRMPISDDDVNELPDQVYFHP